MASPASLAMYSDAKGATSDSLVERYAPLVKRIAHHLMARLPASVQVDDLIQSGLIGLLEAARHFDGGKGASFETYAGIRIRGAMIDEVRRGDWAPRSVHRNARRASVATRAVEARLGRDATDTEVAGEMGIPVDEYHRLLQDSLGTRLFSFEELYENGEEPDDFGSAPGHGPQEEHQQDAMRQQLADAIRGLPERERLVLALYYDEELNLKEIGQVLGVSESRVSQIHSQAAMRLRSRLGAWR